MKSLKDMATHKVTDATIMPFGKHKGIPVGEVPASYLLWWADQDPTTFPELLKYIHDHLRYLEEEAAMSEGPEFGDRYVDWDKGY